jgi:hypothetical protein
VLRFALIAIIVLQVRVALADADSAREPKPQLGYGRYTLISDLGSLGIVASGAAFSEHAEWFVGAGLTTYALGGPIVHLVHRQYARSAASLGVRVGLPLAGLLLGDGIQQLTSGGDPHPWEAWDGPPSPWWLLGTIGGLVGASLIDAKILAGGYYPKPRASATWAPTASASRGGLTLGVVGGF